MHSTDVKYAKSTGHPLGRILADKRPRGDRDWLRIALVGGVVGGLRRVGVWPKLRVVRRECRGIGVPVVRMIGVMFAAVELQKIGGVHEGDVGGGGRDESRGSRAVFDCVVDGEGGRAVSETALLYGCFVGERLDPLIRNQAPLHISHTTAILYSRIQPSRQAAPASPCYPSSPSPVFNARPPHPTAPAATNDSLPPWEPLFASFQTGERSGSATRDLEALLIASPNLNIYIIKNTLRSLDAA
jgi:hypothetical protein